jgi:hypothetical protein
MRYRVRPVFGKWGRRFGRAVPALAVVGPSGTVEDVYPHKKGRKLVTISDFFETFSTKGRKARQT